MSKRSGHQAKKRRDRVKSKKKHVLRIKSGTESQGSRQNSAQTDEVSIGKLKAIIERTATGPLDEQDRQLLLSVSETLQLLTEQLAKKSTFLETAYLILYGELPTKAELEDWVHNITIHTITHENIKKFIDGFHYDAHPMGMLISTVAVHSRRLSSARRIGDSSASNSPN